MLEVTNDMQSACMTKCLSYDETFNGTVVKERPRCVSEDLFDNNLKVFVTKIS